MSFDKRFYGVYEGVVVNSDDPEKRGRVTLQVPQVTGFAETNWASAMGGSPLLYEFPYGSFQDFTSQTIASTTTAYVMTINTTDYSYGVNIVDGSKITFDNYGTFNIQWSGQFQNTSSAEQDVTVWIRKNGVDVVGSSGFITVPPKHGSTNGHTIASWNYILNFKPNDYLQFAWQAESTAISLHTYAAGTTPTTPSTASLIVTATFAGNYRPKPGVRVGVMYLGGDPNFPIWTGEIS
jgi:hypothetical protein